jgi:ribosomal-protein-alanine N-acetyltransferase
MHRNIDEALIDIEMYLEGEKEGRFTWAITLTGTEQLVGLVGCEVRDRDIGIGYILNSHVWGRGYAAESANTLLAWAGKYREFEVAWAVCDAENVTSRKVLSKIGFVDSGVPWTISCPNLSETVRRACLYVRRCGGQAAA